MEEGAVKKTIRRLEISGAAFVIVTGTLLHFVYEWSGSNSFVGVFSPINESVWEHLKLAFFPILFFAFIEYFFLRTEVHNFWFAKAAECLLVMGIIVAFFYAYSGIIGKSIVVIDILSFFAAVIVGQVVSYRLLLKGTIKKRSAIVPAIVLLLIAASFIVCTFYPPHIPLFKDSQTITYGIYKTK
ncbi:MAG: DUF6512 family protein [Candidatus Eisenbacteria bacterium]|nr:hypothetical protein [Actinomycetota bacterium]